MEIIVIVVSVVSLVVATTTLYLTQLQAPRLAALCGPVIMIYYSDYEQGGSFGLYLPVTFVNKSARTGVVYNAAIRLYRNDFPQESYFMQWRGFGRISPQENIWVRDEMAHALAILGKSTVPRIIFFVWPPNSKPKVILREGAYTIDFYFWDRKDKPPRHQIHEFRVSGSIHNQLESYRSTEKSTTVDIILEEAKRLLGPQKEVG